MNTPKAANGVFFSMLRRRRKLTQQDLAWRAQVGLQTIRKVEQTGECKWRPVTATLILQALDSVARLTEGERARYVEMTGMTPSADVPVPDADVEFQDRSADEVTAMEWMEILINERGAARVLAWLEALAAANDIDLPPKRSHRTPAGQLPRWALVHPPTFDAETGRSVQVFEPVPKQPTPTRGKTAGGSMVAGAKKHRR